MSLFPLLEKQYPDVTIELEQEFGRHGIDRQWLSEFPFGRIAASAMMPGSKFWPDDALEWASSLLVARESEKG